MSYQVLARKWRPRFFKEMVGQEHVLRALINALDNNRLHHAYLFTGTRGVGKTTIARILAKCLNCETGVTSEPCGQCSSCIEISEGRFVDLIEVDAASRTRVEDTRELLDNVQYAPTRGRFKVYLIDEVHMLSTHSFNALLKTLEEPPEHVKFLLATTDPQKLPVTILSRCLQFSLKNMSPERIVDYLQFVLGEEKVPFDDAALWHLGRAADGSMRDALSLTDQAIAFGQGQVRDTDVSAMLGSIDRGKVVELVKALLSMDAAMILDKMAALAEHSPDYSALLADLIAFLHRIAVAQAVPAAVDNSQGDRELLLDLAQQVTAEDIQLFYQSALIGRRDLPLVPDARSGLEMILLRMLAFRPQGVPVPPSQPLKVSAAVKKTKATVAAIPESSVVAETAQTQVSTVVETPQPTTVNEVVAEEIAPAPVAATDPDPEREHQPVEEPSVKAELDVPFVVDAPANPVKTIASPAMAAAAPSLSEAPALNSAPPLLDSHAAPSSESVQNMAPESVEPEPVAEQASQVEVQPEALVAEMNAVPVQQTPEQANVVPEKASPTAAIMDQLNNPAAVAAPVIAEVKAAPEPARPVASWNLAELQLEQWHLLFADLQLTGMLRNIAANSALAGIEGNQISLVVSEEQSRVYNQGHAQRIQDSLSQVLNQPISLLVTIGQPASETPAQRQQRIQQERLQQAIVTLQNDPNIQALEQHFAGHLQLDSVQPIQRSL